MTASAISGRTSEGSNSHEGSATAAEWRCSVTRAQNKSRNCFRDDDHRKPQTHSDSRDGHGPAARNHISFVNGNVIWQATFAIPTEVRSPKRDENRDHRAGAVPQHGAGAALVVRDRVAQHEIHRPSCGTEEDSGPKLRHATPFPELFFQWLG